MTGPTFVLASASPARLRTLRAAGLDPEAIPSGVDESTVESTNAETLCAVLARLKAEAVVKRLHQHQQQRPAPTLVLGCDSLLAFDGQILGKPVGAADAAARWRQLRGRSGILHTGHCLIRAEDSTRTETVASTTIDFANVTDAEIDAYVATGEPLQVAGGFTIDGLGGFFVDRISGDAGNVVGVSLPVLRGLLADLGVAVADLWAAH